MLKIYVIGRPEFSEPTKWFEGNNAPREDQLRGWDGDKLIETAGRICYDSFGKGRTSKEYHRHILDVGHGSVVEHANYTFLVSGISRALSAELNRHRAGTAISQRSTRYVDESASLMVYHPVLRDFIGDRISSLPRRASLLRKVEAANKLAKETYRLINKELEEYLMKKGVDPLVAKKQARGAARMVLGLGLETEQVWSANVRALRHIIQMRAVMAADAEIREFAIALLEIMKAELPPYFEDLELQESPIGKVLKEGSKRL
jgi:thymidylate synthase (FAD)